jgi:TolB protein
MKKTLVLVTLLVIPILTYGELFLEITKGSEDPFKVAMIPFEGNSRTSKQLNNIMRNDLIRTGEFSILDEELLLPLKMINEELVYSDWKLLGMDYLVTGTIIDTNNSLDINYEIYDIYKKKKSTEFKSFWYPEPN